MNMYISRIFTGRAVDVRVAEIESSYEKQAKKLDDYRSYGRKRINILVVDHFGVMIMGFKQSIYFLAKVAV